MLPQRNGSSEMSTLPWQSCGEALTVVYVVKSMPWHPEVLFKICFHEGTYIIIWPHLAPTLHPPIHPQKDNVKNFVCFLLIFLLIIICSCTTIKMKPEMLTWLASMSTSIHTSCCYCSHAGHFWAMASSHSNLIQAAFEKQCKQPDKKNWICAKNLNWALRPTVWMPP